MNKASFYGIAHEPRRRFAPRRARPGGEGAPLAAAAAVTELGERRERRRPHWLALVHKWEGGGHGRA